jgi:signal transduction histidine kinase
MKKTIMVTTMFKNFSIKGKLRLAVILSSLGMIFMCWQGVVGMDRALTTVREMGEVKLQAVLAVGQIRTSLQQLEATNKEVLEARMDFGSPRTFEMFKVKRDDALFEFNDGWSRYEKLPKDKDEEELWNMLQDSRVTWERADKELEEILTQLATPMDQPQFEDVMFQYENGLRATKSDSDFVRDAVSGLYFFLSEASVKATVAALETVEANKKTMFGSAAGIILFTLIFGVLIVRSISKPLQRMIKAITDIQTSKDYSHRVTVESHDEIGVTIVAFNDMVAKIEESSAQLQQKTHDIQAMLQNMPQGILTIVEGNKVHPEYSDYLEAILETKDIADRDFMDLIFADSNLGADSWNQVETVASACIGEDAMNFEFNAGLLVLEVEKRMPDGRSKWLDFSWSAIADETDTIQKLMLCVRDVTELRKLEAQAGEQKRQLEIIGEILAVSQEKFSEFISSAEGFVAENKELIEKTPSKDAEVIAALFRNMHTIKGNARTYNFLHLTNVVHVTEQAYDDLRKDEEAVWDRQTLTKQLASVEDQLAVYRKINEDKLGRKGPGRRGNVDKYLMVDRDVIQRMMTHLTHATVASPEKAKSLLQSAVNDLKRLGCESFAEVVAGSIESLPALSQELGKEAPHVNINDNGILVRSQVAGLLKNAFMHLLRNSMDHGLESAASRVAVGKPAAGTISLDLSLDQERLTIALSDDGRGLALKKIRESAVSKGLLTPELVGNDAAVAKAILKPGFSTAESVTEVSGRGVGMDAVKDFVEREGGSISFVFTDENGGADFRQFKTLVTLPARFAVQII